ncbi:Retrovirus-related Pol polyprotein from transposon TNT 1-94 [Gossypium australe]|uniref:Retrovirus-related Pol polyprotein from transposon TNT 1-94 n=1 Tax=Gossypium australe TaxID=47621 RepID=A0A5B6VTW7_9ROSI|nr:Retrovirus-related Pol polyprotein from transposon TNT 1-94 [Gossypium australe]
MQTELKMITRTKLGSLLISHHIIKTKLNVDGSLNRLMARLIVNRFSQQYEVHYMETYASVARLDTIRLLLALAAQMGWKIHQLDVK